KGRPYAVWDFPRNTLVDADVVGLGLTAVHRSLYEEMRRKLRRPHWYNFIYNDAGDFMPEDNAFCWRAQELCGAKIQVHTGIVIGHLKPVLLDERHMKRRERA